MADDEQKGGIWGKVVLILIVLFLIIGLAFFISGGKGLGEVIKTIVIIFSVLVIFILVVVVVWFLFFKEFQRNVVDEEKKDIIRTGEITKPDNVTQLWLSGDEEHPPVLLGDLKGISYRKNYKLLDQNPAFLKLSKEKQERYLSSQKIKKEGTKFYQEETCFVFKRGWAYNIVRCPPTLHTKIHGQIKILDYGLVKHSKYFYPQSMHLDFASIDQTIYEESERRTKLDLLELLHPLMKWASGIKKRFEKEVESKTGKEVVTGKG